MVLEFKGYNHLGCSLDGIGCIMGKNKLFAALTEDEKEQFLNLLEKICSR